MSEQTAGPWQIERGHDGDPYTWIYRDTGHGKEYLSGTGGRIKVEVAEEICAALKPESLPAAAASPQPCEYTFTENGDIVLPDGAPFDGEACLIKIANVWVEAWWMRGRSFETQDGPDHEGFEWVCLDDKFSAELDEAKFWMPLPITPDLQGPLDSETPQAETDSEVR